MTHKSNVKRVSRSFPVLLFIALHLFLSVSCGKTSNSAPEESLLIKRINAVHQQMMRQGNISEEEKEALQSFATLIMNDMFDTKDTSAELLFDDVELVPVYPGCENLSATERKKCFKENVAKLVENEFDFNIPKNLKGLKSHKVDVFFMVDAQGKITNRKIVNTEIQIQAEVARILNQIPNMEPATHNGKEVGVIYTFPIVWGTEE